MDDQLEKYRKLYLRTTIPATLEYEGWNNVRTQLVEHDLPFAKKSYLPGLALASIVLLVTLTSIAQAANPGQSLYPVKLLTDDLVSKVTNKPELKIEKRGQELLELSHNPQNPKLLEAKKQYQQALNEATIEAKQPSQKKQLKQTLKDQQQKFEDQSKSDPASSKKLESVIEQTRKAQGEVQGVKTENSDEKQKNDDRKNKKDENH